MTDFQENSRFDGYYGHKVLWMEDFKGEMKFGDLLRILDVYKVQLHARYNNVYGIWEEVHITSIYHPLAIYNKAVKESDRKSDKIDQFRRRISAIMYHYKVEKNGEFRYEMMAFPFDTTVSDMQAAIKNYEKQELFVSSNLEQIKIEDGEELPF